MICLDEFLAHALHRQMGARLFMDLHTMVVVSSFIISSIEVNYNLARSGEAEATQLLLVMIVGA